MYITNATKTATYDKINHKKMYFKNMQLAIYI